MKAYEMITDDTLRSTLPYGIPAFPFACYYDEIEKWKDHCIQWHWHNEFEFSKVISGSVCCQIGSKTITLYQGDGIFINSGIIHRFFSAQKSTLANILFAPEFIAPKTSELYIEYVQPVIVTVNEYFIMRADNIRQSVILKLFHELWQHTQTTSINKLQVHILTTSLWQQFIKESYSCASVKIPYHKQRIYVRLQAMLNYIHHHYQEALSLDDIAAYANISKSEALRCFHEGIQTTPISYLNEYRLSQAKEQILSTSSSITAIAGNTGFENTSYFCRIFKKKYQISPNQLRKERHSQ